MRSAPWAVLWLVAVLAPLSAQAPRSDDEQIDTLLASSAITWGQASWLVGRSTGAFEEAETPETALAKAADRAWTPPGAKPTQRLDLAQYSFLLVEALRIPGGVLYGWFPGPRYAFRELVYRRVLPPGQEPDAPVSGQDAMNLLQAAQAWKEAHP